MTDRCFAAPGTGICFKQINQIYSSLGVIYADFIFLKL